MTRLEQAAIAIWVGYVALMLFGQSLVAGQWHWVIAGYAILMAGLRGIGRTAEALAIRREIEAFRSMDANEREHFLAHLWPSGLRAEYRRRVDLDELQEIDGTTERFRFPKAEQRLHWQLFWAGATLAGLLSVASLALPWLPFPLRAAAAFLAASLIALLAWLTGRLALLSSVLEVSPFGVSLLNPVGNRLTIPFNQPLLLHDVPEKGYVEVMTPAGEIRLRLHRERVASRRAVELVVERGGFVLPGDEPEAEIQDSAT